MGLRLSLGLVLGPWDSEGGQRPRAGCGVAPRLKCWERSRCGLGGNRAGLPARLELFLEGGHGGAWSGAQAEEHAHRLALFDRLRTRCACAVAGAERKAAECPTKKEHGFHLVLDGASEASAVASPRSSTGLTSPIQTRRIAALTSGELARLAGMLVAVGSEKLLMHGAGRGLFRGW